MSIACLLHPALRRVPRPERGRALRAAQRVPLDVLELVGIAAALVAAAAFAREGAPALRAALGYACAGSCAGADVLAAAVLVVATAGPFLLRRTRRGLAAYFGGTP